MYSLILDSDSLFYLQNPNRIQDNHSDPRPGPDLQLCQSNGTAGEQQTFFIRKEERKQPKNVGLHQQIAKTNTECQLTTENNANSSKVVYFSSYFRHKNSSLCCMVTKQRVPVCFKKTLRRKAFFTTICKMHYKNSRKYLKF